MFSVTRTVAPPTMLIDRRTVLLPSSRERDSVFVPSPGKKKEKKKKKILSCAQRSKRKRKKKRERKLRRPGAKLSRRPSSKFGLYF